METERCDRLRPYDTLFVGERFDDSAHNAGRTDAIGAHEDRLPVPRFVRIHETERFRETCTKREDISDFHCFLFHQFIFRKSEGRECLVRVDLLVYGNFLSLVYVDDVFARVRNSLEFLRERAEDAA